MQIAPTPLPGVLILTPRRFEDDRGFFAEVWNAPRLAEQGIEIDFVQDNQSLSRAPGTVRGLHYQAPPDAQAKLVRAGQGAVWDVAVDARRGSPSYGQATGARLSAENGAQLLVPEGFLHGFVTLVPGAEVLYKCSAPYAPESDGAVHFASPALAIDWGIEADRAILSRKDAAAPDFADWESPFEYAGPLPWEARFPAAAP